MSHQLKLFSCHETTRNPKKSGRSGTFVDNMKLPVHRWFRYSAGFSAEWVEEIVRKSGYESPVILDPFAGSGTVLIAADKLQAVSVGVEAHSFVARIAKAKTLWASSISEFEEKASEILDDAQSCVDFDTNCPDLVKRSFSPSSLLDLSKLKKAWQDCRDESHASELVWLSITAILRPSSSVNTAQWQYILPNKPKKNLISPFEAFCGQIEIMKSDMKFLQDQNLVSHAEILCSDARYCHEVIDKKVGSAKQVMMHCSDG
ncbi:MAG: DNA methyltransferase [Cyanophyceae cyanobacterium]